MVKERLIKERKKDDKRQWRGWEVQVCKEVSKAKKGRQGEKGVVQDRKRSGLGEGEG